jgi:uncharacterized membrane protein YccC
MPQPRRARPALRPRWVREVLSMRPVESVLPAAASAAAATGLPVLLLVLTGHHDLATYAAFGTFTAMYGRHLPYRRRGGALALVGAGFVACVVLGSLAALWLSGWAWALAVAVVAAVAKVACDAAAIGPPGAWMFVFAFATPSLVPTRPADVAVRAGLVVAGTVVGWLVAMLGTWRDPSGPERHATARALDAVADVVTAGPAASTADWHRAHLAIRHARLDANGCRAGVQPALQSLLVLADERLAGSVLEPTLPDGVAARDGETLRASARRLRRGACRSAPPAARALPPVPPPRLPGADAHRSDARVLLMLNGLRVLVGAAAAGALALRLGLGHAAWAPISATAVLQSTHTRMTLHRSIQRALGTVGGVLIAAALFASHPGAVVVACLVVLMVFAVESLIGRNYALGVLFITPLALLLSDLSEAADAHVLIIDRLRDAGLGVTVGLAAGLLLSHPQAARSLREGVRRCREATAWAESLPPQQRGPVAGDQLLQTLLDLREAEDTARGEPWPAGVPAVAVARVEQRGYRALALVTGTGGPSNPAARPDLLG